MIDADKLRYQATWFRFCPSTGEYAGEYCSVRPHDDANMVPMVRLDAILSLAEENKRLREALGAVDERLWQVHGTRPKRNPQGFVDACDEIEEIVTRALSNQTKEEG